VPWLECIEASAKTVNDSQREAAFAKSWRRLGNRTNQRRTNDRSDHQKASMPHGPSDGGDEQMFGEE
jgi:hypothetical protein